MVNKYIKINIDSEIMNIGVIIGIFHSSWPLKPICHIISLYFKTLLA